MDEIYGIGCFLSSLPGIGGKIKATPEDFIVEEIPIQITKEEGGKYLILKVRLREWDTNKFLITLARRLGISRKRITYAGTKDKFAVTTQYFCINIQDNEELIGIGDAQILESFRTGRMLRLGDLVGNTFSIRITPDDGTPVSADRIMEIYGDVSGKGGFPNFFGPQRFVFPGSKFHGVKDRKPWCFFCSWSIERRWSALCLLSSTCPNIMVADVLMPSLWASSITDSHCLPLPGGRPRIFRTSSENISAPAPGILSMPLSTSVSSKSLTLILDFLDMKDISDVERPWMPSFG